MQALPIAAGFVFAVKSLRDAAARRQKLDDVMNEYRELFNTPVPRLHQLRDALVEQMEAGLAGKPGGLMMLPSYVDLLPSGHERGHCYAIDLGGTNLRVAHVQLGEQRGATAATHIREWPIPEDHFDTDRGTLLRFVAERTAEVVREHGEAGGSQGQGGPVAVGFCFSFPMDQTALDNGKVLGWTKNFRGSYLVGQDVVAALRAELAAQGLHATVPAIMNDTVATLVALRYSEPDTQLGIILGTGTNCAYLERVSAISKLPPGFTPRSGTGTDRMIVNSEWADFRSPLLPSCDEDVWLDCSSPHPGSGLLEKQMSGLYLGEVARRCLLRLAERAQLFGAAVPALLTRHYGFTTAHLAAIDEDASADLAGVAAVLEQALGIRGASWQQRQTAQEVCRLVCLRSARLCAAAIAGVLKRSGHPCGGGGAGDGPSSTGGSSSQRVVVAVDGSVFSKYRQYRERLRAALEDVCGKPAADSIELQLAQDGSVLGAAFLAVAAARWEAEHGSIGGGRAS